MFLFSFFAILEFDIQNFRSQECLFSAQDYSPVFVNMSSVPKQKALLPKKKSWGSGPPNLAQMKKSTAVSRLERRLYGTNGVS